MKLYHLMVLVMLLFAFGCGRAETAAVVSGSSLSSSSAPVVSDSSLSASQGKTVDVHVDSFDFGFTQDNVAIHQGDHVRLHVTSSDGTHGVTIPSLGLATGRVANGAEEIIEFDAKEAGTFDYHCNVPCGSGHSSMRGQIVVQP